MNNQQPKLKAKDHESYTALSLLAFFIPIAGIIYLGKKDPLDRKLGNSLITISIISVVLVSLLWYFKSMAAVSQASLGL